MGRAWCAVLTATLTITCVALAPPGHSHAQGSKKIEATVLLRALSYDRNLKARAGADVTALVLFNPDDSSSLADSNAIGAAFSALEKIKVQGLGFRARVVPYRGTDDLRNRIARDGVDLVYVCSGLSGRVPAISDATRDLDVLSAGQIRGDVQGGLTLGVFERGNKREIVVNLMASKAEGANFSAQFLGLAEIIR